MKITKSGAEALYLGIVGDTARFMYRNTDERTFAVAEAWFKKELILLKSIIELYMKKAKDLQINKFILNNHQFAGGVAYYVLSDADLKMLEISRERGSDFVNLLSGVEEY